MSQELVRVSEDRLARAVGERWSRAELGEALALLTRADGGFAAGVTIVDPELARAVRRERLLAAMTAAGAAIPYRDLSVKDVLARAGVSRPVFYEHFADKEECFLAAFDAAAAELSERVEAAAHGDDWRQRARRGLEALLLYCEEQAEAARLAVVAARGSTPAGVARREELMERFAACLEQTVRAELAEPPSPIAAAGVVGGVEALLYPRLRDGREAELGSLLPSLMYFAALAFLGPEAAELGDEPVGFAAR
jgi:AcrR family transcriptional regulator